MNKSSLVIPAERIEERIFYLRGIKFDHLKSHFVTSTWGGMRRALPYAFSEQGIAMLSSVLRSRKAINVNIKIIRAFVRLREMLASNAELARKLVELESKYDKQFKIVFDAIRQLMAPSPAQAKPIGFRTKALKR